jgi:hypothetical protein
MNDENFTVEEAASYLGVTPNWLYKLRGRGAGPVSWRAGNKLVFPKVELDLYRARQRQRTMRGEGVTA